MAILLMEGYEFYEKKNIPFSVIRSSDQNISIQCLFQSVPLVISAIYVSNNGTTRRLIWQHIHDLEANIGHLPWILGGDFNIILHSNESFDNDLIGPLTSPDMREFQNVLHDLYLFDHPFFGPLFTLSNKQQSSFLARKLDRVLINSSWATTFKDSHVEFLSPGISDHCLAQVWLSKELQANRPKPFKFFNYWTHHPNFLDVVNQSWSKPALGNPIQILFSKLKRVKQIKTLRGEDSFDKELFIQNEVKKLEEAEALYFRQKAKVQWLKEGDKCTIFFHSAVALKNKRDIIRILIDEQGNQLETYDLMSAEVVNFFTNLLGLADSVVKGINPNLLKHLINYSLTAKKSVALVKDVTKEEIKEAIFSQGNEKSSGSDGFSPFFFKTSWHIIESDVIAAVSHFFSDSFLLPAFNVTVIALVPKVPNQSKVKDFRTISCCSVIYKAISKILVRRLTLLLPDLVALNQ
ncbi:uncharacterized protein LOC120139999 [Hibiscus syriacus]|uniref:uncharacterized protein LOC120139999 n=1 Tax=Hibiscus syriacus TaxID=106335 RepID=UPI00192247C9|nr:uncharacterized protein LOC120139999 [Hibiscus syriacus]